MRWPSIVLALLVVALQYPLWIGKGGWLRVWDVDRQLQQQKEINRALEMRNAGLDAEAREDRDARAVEPDARRLDAAVGERARAAESGRD